MEITLRKSVLLVLVVFTMVVPGFAQMDGMSDLTPEERAQMATEKQKEQLNLTDEQTEDMYALNLKYMNEMMEIRKGGRSMSTMRKLRDMGSRKDKETKAVLDKQQYKEYLKMKDEMRSQMKARRGRR